MGGGCGLSPPLSKGLVFSTETRIWFEEETGRSWPELEGPEVGQGSLV